jgi:hypothetical protein
VRVKCAANEVGSLEMRHASSQRGLCDDALPRGRCLIKRFGKSILALERGCRCVNVVTFDRLGVCS